jgi:1,2-diacylglycerol 3-alpha-glucosyltransferase
VRVLLISDVYFPRVNGVSTSIRTFRQDLGACGVETSLVVPEYGTSCEDTEPNVVRVSGASVPKDPEDRRMRWGSLMRTLDAFPPDAFDLVHIHTPFVAHYAGVKYARRAGIPCVATYHTFFEEYLHHYVPALPRRVGRSIAKAFTRSQCRDVQALIAPSEPMRDVLLAYGVTTPIHVLPTGLPLDRFKAGQSARFRAHLAVPPDQPLVTYVGRVAHEKNIDFLMNVFADVRRQVPHALLVIAGEGPARAPLREQAARMGLDAAVRFVGYLDRDTGLLDCYAAANVFVFASRTETQGLVLLEAMAQGTPVVSTAELGTRFVLRPGCGAVVVPEEKQAFADAIVRVLQDESMHRELAGRGREYAQQWSSAALGQRLATLYRSTLGSVTGVGARRHPAAALPDSNPKLEREFFCATLPEGPQDRSGSRHGSEARVNR